MSNEYQSTSINPDVFEQFLTLLNTHCQSSEESLAMLSTLCFDEMWYSVNGQPHAQRYGHINATSGY